MSPEDRIKELEQEVAELSHRVEAHVELARAARRVVQLWTLENRQHDIGRVGWLEALQRAKHMLIHAVENLPKRLKEDDDH